MRKVTTRRNIEVLEEERPKRRLPIPAKANTLSREEVAILWRVAEDPKDKLIIALGAGLGLRASEIAHLKSHWIEWQEQKLEIPLQDGDFKAKSPKAARSIYFGNRFTIASILRKYFELYNEVGLTRQAVFKRVKKLAAKAGVIKRVSPQVLRATAAYQYAEAGLSGQALRQIMGWESLATAERYIEASGRAAEQELREKGEKLWL